MTPEQAELKALGFEVPDSITPIVACRSWKIRKDTLLSHNGTPWTPGKAMKAVCRVGGDDHHLDIVKYWGNAEGLNPEDIPLQVCSCGFYAAKHEEANHIVPISPGYIHGEIYMWGKIVEGPNGYRSEFAYPKRFFATNRAQKEAIEAMGFGVPVILVDGGAYPYHFPFPRGSAQVVVHQAARNLNRLYSMPLLPGVPALAIGLVDGLTLDMSRGFNQALVAVLCSIGVLAAAISLYAFHLRKKMKRMMESAVRVNGIRISSLPPTGIWGIRTKSERIKR